MLYEPLKQKKIEIIPIFFCNIFTCSHLVWICLWSAGPHVLLPALKESVPLFLAEVFGRWTVIAKGGFRVTIEQSTSFVLCGSAYTLWWSKAFDTKSRHENMLGSSFLFLVRALACGLTTRRTAGADWGWVVDGSAFFVAHFLSYWLCGKWHHGGSNS